MNVTRIERSGSVEFGFSDLPWQGVISCALLIVQVILLLAALYISYLSEGSGGLAVGIAGFMVFLFSAAGIVIAFLGFRRKNIRHGLCAIGGVGSVLMLAGMIVLCAVA